MELFSAEVSKIKDLIDAWRSNPEVELEATFGLQGIVDMQTFLRVVQRLQSKGLGGISQSDRLTVSLKNSLRFTLSGANQVAQYCRDNTMAGKPFIVMSKSRATSEQNTSGNVDVSEYNVRIKIRNETPIQSDNPNVQQVLSNWSNERKFFRLIRRWTFKAPGLKFDLSMVRSTQPNKQGFTWQKNFADQNLIAAPPEYEIEVELDRQTIDPQATTDQIFQTLVKGLGDVLRGVQNSPILIRNSLKEKVLKGYKELTGTTIFRGNRPATLEYRNMAKDNPEQAYNIRDNYNVTDKADGLRTHGFTDEHGELFLLDMSFQVYRTGYKQPSCKHALLDGEYVTKDKHGKPIQEFLIFDIYYASEKKDVSQLPFYNPDPSKTDTRYAKIQEWLTDWSSNGGPVKTIPSTKLRIACKTFYFPDSTKTIFQCASKVLDQKVLYMYHQDGLIFTPNDLPLPSRPRVGFEKQFKWKPADENTIDFLIEFEKDPNTKQDKISFGIHPDTQETIRYKTLRLFVGSRSIDPAYANPRDTILFERPLPGSVIGGNEPRGKLKAILFEPSEFPDRLSSVCYLETQTDPRTREEYVIAGGEPVRGRSILEMSYHPKASPGWRWKPLRIRADKTDRLLRSGLEDTLNSIMTASSIWKSIHEPVTEHMIRTGADQPSVAEMAELRDEGKGSQEGLVRYYERTVSKDDKAKVQTLRTFHNRYIKEIILYGSLGATGTGKKLVDFAVGRASDLHQWRRIGASFVLGIDKSIQCCLDNDDGGYKRLLDTIVQKRTSHRKDDYPIPPMFFVVGDSSLRIMDGTASGEFEQDANILRSIYGQVPPTSDVPPAVKKYGENVLLDKADACICMHAIHYFFETEDTFNGFLQNLADSLAVGGYFIGTNFDGEAVYDLLRNTPKGISKQGKDKDDRVLWEITKLYDDTLEGLPQDDSAFGKAIDVNFVSIGATHKEYLVPWELLQRKLKTIGCELLSQEELATIGLQSSSNMYKTSYEMAMKRPDNKKFMMDEVSQTYSFLNRWYIFKRTSEGGGAIGKLVEGEELVAEAEGTEMVVPEGVQTIGAVAGQEEITDLTAAVADSIGPAGFVARFTEASTKGDMNTLRQLDQEALQLLPTRPPEQPEALPGSIAQTYISSALPKPVAASLPVAGPNLTVPVVAKTMEPKQTYEAKDVFQFQEESPESIRFFPGLPKYAARILAPNARFRIVDTKTPDALDYPTITHYLAAMKFKYASNKPEFAKLFSRTGSIYLNFLSQRETEAQTKGRLTEDRQREFTLQESNAVLAAEKAELSKTETGFVLSKWLAVENELLSNAILQRLTNDTQFCAVLSKLKDKYLLYVKPNKGGSDFDMLQSNLGGERTAKKTIQGQNLYGRTIMKLVAEHPDVLQACLSKPQPKV